MTHNFGYPSPVKVDLANFIISNTIVAVLIATIHVAHVVPLSYIIRILIGIPLRQRLSYQSTYLRIAHTYDYLLESGLTIATGVDRTIS